MTTATALIWLLPLSMTATAMALLWLLPMLMMRAMTTVAVMVVVAAAATGPCVPLAAKQWQLQQRQQRAQDALTPAPCPSQGARVLRPACSRDARQTVEGWCLLGWTDTRQSAGGATVCECVGMS